MGRYLLLHENFWKPDEDNRADDHIRWLIHDEDSEENVVKHHAGADGVYAVIDLETQTVKHFELMVERPAPIYTVKELV
jgi:hypothetical protein